MKIKNTIALAALLAGVAIPAAAQVQSVGGGFVEGIKNRLPINAGTDMANAAAGEEVLTKDGAPDIIKTEKPEDFEVETAEADESVVDREYDEEADPITEHALKVLDQSGILARQMGLADAMVMMENELKLLGKVEEVLKEKGPDARIEVSPGVFRSFDGTPSAMRAEIEYLKLKGQLAEARRAAQIVLDGPDEVSSAAAGEKNAAGKGKTETPTASRNDGTDAQAPAISALPGLERNTGRTRDAGLIDDVVNRKSGLPQQTNEKAVNDVLAQAEERLAERNAEINKKLSESGMPTGAGSLANAEAAPASLKGIHLSLREVFGGKGKFTAIIEMDGAKQEVKVGDLLKNSFTVTEITPGSIVIGNDSGSTTFEF